MPPMTKPDQHRYVLFLECESEVQPTASTSPNARLRHQRTQRDELQQGLQDLGFT
jgi:hypothetical protein